MSVLWRAVTTNSKTGNIPTGYIGGTVEEAWDTCNATGCPLLHNGQCYAWNGTPHLVMIRMTRHDMSYYPSLEEALPYASPDAEWVRLGALGDPFGIALERIRTMRRVLSTYGFRGILGYTHAWRNAKHLIGQLMASCDSLKEADEAIDMGWRATAVLPMRAPRKGVFTPKGRRVVGCPAQTHDNVTCNSCGLCDGSRKLAKPIVIGFYDHGPKARAAKYRDRDQLLLPLDLNIRLK